MTTGFDAASVGLYSQLLSSIAEEMGTVLERSSFSPNIKERRDHSCGLFTSSGLLAAQAAHIPVHLGAMEFLLQKWLADGPSIEAGRTYISNDPFFAGTHLPDITFLRAVEVRGRIIGYVANRAHHADVGGSSPGSFAPAPSVHEEGVLIRPQEATAELIAELAGQMRNPKERIGDLQAQAAANLVGADRLSSLANRWGDEFDERIAQCLAYSEAHTRNFLRSVPRGEWTARESLDPLDDGEVLNICLRIECDGNGGITFDFSGTSPQAPMGINATEAVTRSACYYVVRCLCSEAPANHGCFAPVSVNVPAGTILNAVYPAPVVAGNTETSQRTVDAILRTLQQALPDLAPACSQGTMNNLALGTDEWAYYETIAGGAGGGPNRAGASAVHTHMTNTRNTPIEAMEIELPVRFSRYEMRRGSGGDGVHSGGDGVIREFEVLEDEVTLSLMTERRTSGPCGAQGGAPGSPGRNLLLRRGEFRPLGSRDVVRLAQDDVVRIETPGGGGWGKPAADAVLK